MLYVWIALLITNGAAAIWNAKVGNQMIAGFSVVFTALSVYNIYSLLVR